MLLPHSLSPLEPQGCPAGPKLLNHFSPLVPLRLLPRYFFHLLVFFGPFGPGARWRLPPCPSTSGPPAEKQKSNFGSLSLSIKEIGLPLSLCMLHPLKHFHFLSKWKGPPLSLSMITIQNLTWEPSCSLRKEIFVSSFSRVVALRRNTCSSSST